MHVYQECFDEQKVFLKKDSPDLKLTLEMSLEEFVGLGAATNYESLYKQANISDEKIKCHVESIVNSRSAQYCPFSQFHETEIFGEMTNSIQDQIDRGIAFYTKKRDSLKLLVEKIQNQKTKYFFGLEDLL